MSFVSKDGLNWEFQGIIANNHHQQLPATDDGPTEASTVLLPNGRLQTIYRMTAGTRMWQSFSDDLGKTWTWGEPLLSAGNGTVLPQIITLKNGVTLLSSGRPGIWLYATQTPEDPSSWVGFSITENHDRQVANKEYVYGPDPACPDVSNGVCSGYTSMVATSDSTALVCYDQGGGSLHPGQSYIWCVEAFTMPMKAK